MRAAIYVRVSTEDQARHGYSLSAQVEACRGRAAALGATEMLAFSDEGVSGALLVRPGLDGLREAVRERRVELVVLWDPDRLSRNLSHQLLLTEEIERARIRLEFVNFEWKATPEGQLFYALRGAIAQYEKEKIRERTSRGRLQKAKEGKLPLAFRPYGYAYDSDTALLTVNPEEAAVVGQIFRWLLEEGEGPNGIARRLNQLGVPARKGGRWHRAVVRQILANPVYTGIFWCNRWDAAGVSLNRHRPPAERVSPTLRPEGEWLPVPVPALIDPSRWQQAQALLAGARRLWAGRPRADYLLSGLLLCGRCGRSMSGFAGTDWGVKRRKYTCRRGSEGDRGGACGRAVAAEPLEAAVWDSMLDWLGADLEALRATAAGAVVPVGAAGGELTAIAEAVAQAERGRTGVMGVLEQGLMPAAEAAAALQRIQERLAGLEQRRAELEAAEGARAAARAAAGSGAPDRAAWAKTAAGALSRFREGAGLDAAERRRLVRLLVARVEVGEEELTLHARWLPLASPPPESPGA
jgi:site-specific DNA recombinase